MRRRCLTVADGPIFLYLRDHANFLRSIESVWVSLNVVTITIHAENHVTAHTELRGLANDVFPDYEQVLDMGEFEEK